MIYPKKPNDRQALAIFCAFQNRSFLLYPSFLPKAQSIFRIIYKNFFPA